MSFSICFHYLFLDWYFLISIYYLFSCLFLSFLFTFLFTFVLFDHFYLLYFLIFLYILSFLGHVGTSPIPTFAGNCWNQLTCICVFFKSDLQNGKATHPKQDNQKKQLKKHAHKNIKRMHTQIYCLFFESFPNLIALHN